LRSIYISLGPHIKSLVIRISVAYSLLPPLHSTLRCCMAFSETVLPHCDRQGILIKIIEIHDPEKPEKAQCLANSGTQWMAHSLITNEETGYRSGSHTAVQAWRPCPLWEPSHSHPIVLVYTRDLLRFFVCVFLYCVAVFCVVCFFWVFLTVVGFFYFSTLILLVGSFNL